MYIKLGEKTVKITFLFAVFFAVAANFTGGKSILLSFLFSFIHEMIHLVFLHFAGLEKAHIVLLPAAVKIHCEGLNILSYKKTVLCTLSAPVFNILTGVVFLILRHYSPLQGLEICAAINLILGIINMFPLEFLDGGRAIRAVLCTKYDENKAAYILKRLSVLSLIVLFVIFFIGCIFGRVQLFLLIFCVYCLVGTLKS